MKNKTTIIKIIAVALAIVMMAIAGYMFREHRTYKEPVVVSEYITEVKKLSDYSDVIKGTVNDCNVYIFDSGVRQPEHQRLHQHPCGRSLSPVLHL